MTYSTVQSAVLTLVRAYADGMVFGTKNSAEYDTTVLDAGGPNVFCILNRASDTEEADAFEERGHGQYGMRQQRHQVGITIAAKIGQTKDAGALALLQSTVEGVTTWLRAHPVLGGVEGVKYAAPRLQTRPRGINKAGMASATHWASTIVIEVYEEVELGWLEAGQ